MIAMHFYAWLKLYFDGSAKHHLSRLFSILGQVVDVLSGIKLHKTHALLALRTSTERCNVCDVKNVLRFTLKFFSNYTSKCFWCFAHFRSMLGSAAGVKGA
jgi:hypothetical protein